jgi:hypothetical protein
MTIGLLTPVVKFATFCQFAAAAFDTGGAPCIAKSFKIFFLNAYGDLSGPVEKKTVSQKSLNTVP